MARVETDRVPATTVGRNQPAQAATSAHQVASGPRASEFAPLATRAFASRALQGMGLASATSAGSITGPRIVPLAAVATSWSKEAVNGAI